jgi:hypothetical protein
MRVSSGPSHLIHPSFTRASSAKINSWVVDALFLKDWARREAHRVGSKWLQSQRLKRWVEEDLDLACP